MRLTSLSGVQDLGQLHSAVVVSEGEVHQRGVLYRPAGVDVDGGLSAAVTEPHRQRGGPCGRT